MARQQLLFVLAVLALAVPATSVLHASCKLTWVFDSHDCGTVNQYLTNAIGNMSNANCGNSEKCLYTLKTRSASEITATHETPKHHYVDDLSISFGTGTPCTVQGYSKSTIWYAVLDDGTNYCNLHNLLLWTGLKATETTSDSVCTQYSTANCAKY